LSVGVRVDCKVVKVSTGQTKQERRDMKNSWVRGESSLFVHVVVMKAVDDRIGKLFGGLNIICGTVTGKFVPDELAISGLFGN
jgi:hypothetical protein